MGSKYRHEKVSHKKLAKEAAEVLKRGMQNRVDLVAACRQRAQEQSRKASKKGA